MEIGDADHARALGVIRTPDTRFRKPMLYPLSYEGGGCDEPGATRGDKRTDRIDAA